MDRDELRTTVRRYQLELPENFKAPSGLNATQLRTSPRSSDAEWTIIGDEHDITSRLANAGARVREIQPLSFEDAALSLLSAESQ